jgi:uncharacterized membrane protein/nitrite reductase/ring-hydroxylating ferredoxin subunit
MRSKAHFKSHPLHPILIAFPIAFFTGTLLFDLLGFITDSAMLWQTGEYLNLAAIIFALIAAVPGFIDYLYTVPPKSTGKKRAAKHGIINVTNVAVFTVAYFCKQNEDASVYVILALEVVGMILLSIAGWMGGTLVYRNQIGVDPRYANAGKWKELHTDKNSGEIEVAESDELKVNQMKLIHTKDKRIVLGRTEQSYVAFDDRCTHRGGSLAGGAMICGTVQCPWHGSQFDVNNGVVKAGPAEEKIETYTVKEANGKVYLVL